MNATLPGIRDLMNWAAPHESEIEDDKLLEEAEGRDLEEDQVRRMEIQLYALLVSITENEAATIVENSGDDKGFEAWRSLNRRFDLHNTNRQRATLDALMARPRVELPYLANAIEEMKKMMTQHEQRKGKPVDEDVKQTVLRGIVPKLLKQHLEMNRTRLRTFAEMLAEVETYVIENRPDGIQAMDVNYMGKGRTQDVNWLGGSKGGKKGGKKGKGKGKTCFVCGRENHKAKDCWHDKGKGKGGFGDKGQQKGGKGKSYGKSYGGKNSGGWYEGGKSKGWNNNSKGGKGWNNNNNNSNYQYQHQGQAPMDVNNFQPQQTSPPQQGQQTANQ